MFMSAEEKRTKEMQKEHTYKNQVPKTKEDISNEGTHDSP
jgi:hypothetical protein